MSSQVSRLWGFLHDKAWRTKGRPLMRIRRMAARRDMWASSRTRHALCCAAVDGWMRVHELQQAAAIATNKALYFTQLFDEFNIDVSGDLLFVDNHGAIKTVGKSDISNRLKYIDVRYHLIKDHVAKKNIKIIYVE
eukprot:366259-Chlamydomonas_euryale.AAC.10